MADPIFPDYDKFEEDIWLSRVKRFGIEGVEFYIDNGFGIIYNTDIISPGCISEGVQTFQIYGKTDCQLIFKYRNDLSGIDLFTAHDLAPDSNTPIATIPILDYFSEVLCQ